MIRNAANVPLNFNNGTLPDVSGALQDWFQPMVFGLIKKSVSAFQNKEVVRQINFMGMIQRLKPRDLELKPEGQRSWSWFQIHSDLSLELNTDDVVTYRDTQLRVMARFNWELNGYREYHAVQDFVGSGP